MSNNPVPPQQPQQIVDVKSDPARDTDLTPQNDSTDSQKHAQMVAAGLLAVTAVQILKRDEELAAQPVSPTLASSSAAAHPIAGASTFAKFLGWSLLLVVGLGSIAGMVAIIIAMLR